MIVNVKKIALMAIVASSALVIAGCNLYKSQPTGGSQNQQQEQSTGGTASAQETVTITFNGSSFEPKEVTVKTGGKITWKNDSQETIQVASDIHPTHSLNKELTNGQFVTELAPGASAGVTVTKTGSWGYHDHLNPGRRGKVIVK